MQHPVRQSDQIEPGDIAPRLPLTGPRGEAIDTSAPPMAGRINVLVLSGSNTDTTRGILKTLADQRARLEDLGGRCFLVTRPVGGRPIGAAKRPLPGLGGSRGTLSGGMPGPVADIGELKAGAMRLIDHSGDTFRIAGTIDESAAILVIGANLHVIDVIRNAAGPDSIERILTRLENRTHGQGSPMIHPPVLTVPDVFSPEDNAHLMSIFHTRGKEFVEPGHSALGNRTTDCKMRIPDLGRRDRIDHWVVETDTQAFITDRLRKRLFPEVQKAFNYSVTRHERYRLARYEGERGGEQMGHRDNIDPSVAHRRFAVTINLNAEDYEGAEIRFPEYSGQLYKPASGTAIVFSCSLLHEVIGMRSGSRFAMLAFLFGDG
jgi:hypothetical protein